MNPILDTLKAFFSEEGWEHNFTAETPPPRFYVPFQVKMANGRVALALDTQHQMIFYSPQRCVQKTSAPK